MKDPNLPIDELLRKALEHHAVAPPEGVWAALEQRLPPPQKRRGGGWWWAVVLLLLLSTGFSVYHFSSNSDNPAGIAGTTAARMQLATQRTEKNPTTSLAATKLEPAINDLSDSVTKQHKTDNKHTAASTTFQRFPSTRLTDDAAVSKPGAITTRKKQQTSGRIPRNAEVLAPAIFTPSKPGSSSEHDSPTQGSTARKPRRARAAAISTDSTGQPLNSNAGAAILNTKPAGRGMQNTQTSANKKLKPAAIRTGSATNLPADAKSSAVVKPENAPDPSPGKIAVTRAPRLKAAAKLNSPKDRVTSKLTIITPATGSRATAAATAARSTNGKTTNSGNPLQAGVPATKTKAVNTHSATSKHAEAPAAAGRTAQRRGNNARRISNTATATADSPETATEPALRLPARAPETVATLPPNAPQKGRFSDDDPRGDKGILLSSLYPDKKNSTATTAAPTGNEDAGSEEKLPAPTSGSGGGAAGAAASGENTPPDRARWEGGVKLGYEMGFSSSNINKVVLAPYVQYNINNRAAVVFQPAYKSGRTRFSAEAGAGKAYYNVIGAPTVTTTANVFSIVDSGGNITNDTLSYKQLIQQTYDSVVITRSLSNSSYWEVELPLLFSYQLSPIFSVMAGPVFSLGRKFSYADNRVTYTLNRAATMDSLLSPITGVDYTNYFTQGTPPLSSYTPESGTVTSAMGLGYLAGVKAGVGMLSAELMVQQRISGIPDAREAQARKALAQPYFRLSIGIRLFGNRKNDNSNKPAMEEMPYRRAEQ